MRLLVVLLLLSVIVGTFAGDDWNRDTLEKEVSASTKTFVLFYVPWWYEKLLVMLKFLKIGSLFVISVALARILHLFGNNMRIDFLQSTFKMRQARQQLFFSLFLFLYSIP